MDLLELWDVHINGGVEKRVEKLGALRAIGLRLLHQLSKHRW